MDENIELLRREFPGNTRDVEKALQSIFAFLGEDGNREGLKETPARMVRSWKRIFGGYLLKPEEILTFFKEDNVIPKGQIILLKDIEFYSTCEHHFLPFVGVCHVAYIPSNRIVGISKLARLVEIFSRRLQIQERIGNQVADALMKHLDALAAACLIEAKHYCMVCRGVEKQNSVMVTSSYKGEFLINPNARQELITLIRGGQFH